jgi:hypothetical protein
MEDTAAAFDRMVCEVASARPTRPRSPLPVPAETSRSGALEPEKEKVLALLSQELGPARVSGLLMPSWNVRIDASA